MTKEERAHRQRMIVFAKTKNEGKPEPLTPEQLAKAIEDLKKKYPQSFPQPVK